MNRIRSLLLFALGGGALAVASLPLGAIVSMSAVLLALACFMVGVATSSRRYLGGYCFGVVFHLSAFYWIPHTLEYFGGFPRPIGVLLLLFFSLVSSLQFLLVVFFYNRLVKQRYLGDVFAFPFAWMLAEFLVPRMFPWSVVLPFSPWESFASLGAFAGTAPLVFLLCFWLSIVSFVVSRRSVGRVAVVTLLLSFVCLGFGWRDARALSEALETAPKVSVALIQGNLEAKQKNDLTQLQPNLEVYRDLSRKAEKRGVDLVIWPEAVLPVWVPEDLKTFRGTKGEPAPDLSVPLVLGGAMYRESIEDGSRTRKFFNSAFAIDSEQNVLGKYHKRALMPFGEYLPLERHFPWLREFSPYSGDLDMGDLREPIFVPLSGEVEGVELGFLICYEDLLPELSIDAVQAGAEILVNLTNDAWYGDSWAPHQHDLLASWRAIETRRYLIRSTNTGLTTIIDPFGRRVGEIPTFTQDILYQKVSPSEIKTFYVRHGDLLAWVLGGVALFIVASSFFSISERKGRE